MERVTSAEQALIVADLVNEARYVGAMAVLTVCMKRANDGYLADHRAYVKVIAEVGAELSRAHDSGSPFPYSAERDALSHRLFPGQGEEYANEVERQRVVIHQFQHAVRGLTSERDLLVAIHKVDRARIDVLTAENEALTQDCDCEHLPDGTCLAPQRQARIDASYAQGYSDGYIDADNGSPEAIPLLSYSRTARIDEGHQP